VDIAELKSKTVGALQTMAEELSIQGASGLNQQQLINRIQRQLFKNGEPLEASGVLEKIKDGYGFLRSPEWSYLPSPDDIYVSPAQIKRFQLRTGDTIAGTVRPPRKRERYMAMLKIDQLNGRDPVEDGPRPDFDELRPRYPEDRLRLERDDGNLSMRVMDLIAPLGKGQRGLIVSPPKAGKTTLLQQIAQSLSENHPEVELIVLLIDERPEEVTEMKAKVKGHVIASTFDESPKRHIQVAEMVLEKAKRLVEAGHDVVILLDSITRLARAFNAAMPRSGRIMSGGIDANALQKPKRFFGAARKLDAGGSLTIVATALIETGSRADDVIFEEFKGTGNMELLLDRMVSDRRIFPAIDINRSSTRKEELLLDETERNRVFLLRNFLGDMPSNEAIEFLLDRMKRYPTNEAFMDAMAAGG
jgi:transcription termination factor Rho